MIRWRKRVPVVLQMADADCGAACPTMVLRHHGIRISLAACREQIGVGRDGISAWSLLDGAKALGLRTAAYRATPKTVAVLPMPLIAHWEDAHFIVVEAALKDGALRVVDPALGRRTSTAEEVTKCPPAPSWSLLAARHRPAPNRASQNRIALLREIVTTQVLTAVIAPAEHGPGRRPDSRAGEWSDRRTR